MVKDEYLTEERELLYRQIHPGFIHDGRVSSQAFSPTPKDENQLSVDRSSLTTARESFEFFISREGCQSAGVYGVTVGECRNCDLSVRADPLEPSPSSAGNAAHALIDFSALPSNSQREKRAKKLARHARDRSWQFRPEHLASATP